MTPFTWFGGKDTGPQPELAGSVPTPNSPELQTSVTPVRAMHDNHLERDGEQRMLSTMPAQHSRSMMHHP